MIAKCARAYVVALLVVELLLVASSLLPQIGFLAGAQEPRAEYGHALLLGSMVMSLLVFCFAKDKHIFTNELKSCPKWLRSIVIAFCAFGFVVLVARTAFSVNPEQLTGTLAASGFTLGYDAMCVSVLYSVLRSGAISEAEFIKRSRISSIAAIVAIAVFVANRAGWMGHQVSKWN
jgi:hypothetical protein